MDQFIVRGSCSLMQWILDLRMYRLKIYYNMTSRGHVEWVRPDELLYKSLQFNMAQFRSMVHGLMGESWRLMRDELLFGSSPSSEPVPTSTRTSRLGLYSCLNRHSARLRSQFVLSRQ
jgi:hypothetical protein